MRVQLDTNVYSAFKRNQRGIVDLVRRCEQVVFSSVVAGELMAGFRWGNRFERNLDELRQFLDHPRVHFAPVTLTTADRYGRIYSALRQKGTPIPTNDMWVAAHAMETGAELVSLDRHFEHVDGLMRLDLG